jgi:hypothetical protein
MQRPTILRVSNFDYARWQVDKLYNELSSNAWGYLGVEFEPDNSDTGIGTRLSLIPIY